MNDTNPSWVHYRCFSCWTRMPGVTEYSESGDEVVGVYIPEGRIEIRDRKIYVCCMCGEFCRYPSWYVDPSKETTRCDHNPETGAVWVVPALHISRKGRKADGASATSHRQLDS